MNDKIIKHIIILKENNLNYTTNNIQVNVHNFLVDTFDSIYGYDTHQHSSYESNYTKKGHGTASMYEYAVRFAIKHYMI